MVEPSARRCHLVTGSRPTQRRLWIDRRLKFNLPLFGPLIQMYAVTKFARTLGILTASGTQISVRAQRNEASPGQSSVLERRHRLRSADKSSGGSSLARAMAEAGPFPEMLVQMTATGEETGQLDDMLTGPRTSTSSGCRLRWMVSARSSSRSPSWRSDSWSGVDAASRSTCPIFQPRPGDAFRPAFTSSEVARATDPNAAASCPQVTLVQILWRAPDDEENNDETEHARLHPAWS